MIGYIIKDKDNISDELWSASLCKKEEGGRVSIDGTKVILKFEFTAIPSVLQSETIYDQTDIGLEMKEGEW